MTIRRETKSYPIAGLKAIDTETGSFEAIVSVFGNVDLHGHRIDSHAFDASLERWKAAGDPIPVIFSHQWDDLSAYLGTIDPNNVRALQPGDPDLPPELAEYGGLFVAGNLDTTEPEGRKAAKLLKSRAVREFSFAYDVFDEAKADDGYLDLLELDILEIGPTLKGANPLTQLVSAKSQAAAEFEEAFAKVADVFNMKSSEVAELVASVTAIVDGSESETAETSDRTAKLKAWVQYAPEGTIESFLETVRVALIDEALSRFAANLYNVAVEGTYSDGRVLFYVELWDEPVGGGTFYEATFSTEGDEIEVGDWTAVDLEVQAVPRASNGENAALVAGTKTGTKEGRRNASSDQARIQDIHDLTSALGADCASEDPDDEASDEEEEEDAGTESRDPWEIRTSLDLELLEI